MALNFPPAKRNIGPQQQRVRERVPSGFASDWIVKGYTQEIIAGRKFIAKEAFPRPDAHTQRRSRLPLSSFNLHPSFMASLQAAFQKDTMTGPHMAERRTTILLRHDNASECVEITATKAALPVYYNAYWFYLFAFRKVRTANQHKEKTLKHQKFIDTKIKFRQLPHLVFITAVTTCGVFFTQPWQYAEGWIHLFHDKYISSGK